MGRGSRSWSQIQLAPRKTHSEAKPQRSRLVRQVQGPDEELVRLFPALSAERGKQQTKRV